MTLKLEKEWLERLRFRAEGYELYAEGDKLRAEGDKLRAEGDKLRAEGKRLLAKGYKLRAEGKRLFAKGYKLYGEGDKLWGDAVLKAQGNVEMKWIYRDGDFDCRLPNGEVYKWDMREVE